MIRPSPGNCSADDPRRSGAPPAASLFPKDLPEPFRWRQHETSAPSITNSQNWRRQIERKIWNSRVENRPPRPIPSGLATRIAQPLQPGTGQGERTATGRLTSA